MKKWLGLRVNGVGDLYLEISATNLNGEITADFYNILLEIKSQNLSLTTKDGKLITVYELKEIVENLKKVLDNKIEDTIIVKTTGEYFSFIFNNDNVRIKINFGPSNDFYSLYLDKHNVKLLYDYLTSIVE